MAMAHRAPESHYRRRFVISAHAIERFRERVDEEFTARPDGDLGNLLDERMCHSTERQTVRDLSNIDKPTEIVRIHNRDGQHYYVVVREQVAVTLLEQHMLEENFMSKRWEPIMNNPFRNALKGVTASVAPGVDRRVPEVEPTEIPGRDAPTHTPLAAAGIDLAQAMFDVDVARTDAVNAATILREAEGRVVEAEIRLDDAKKIVHAAIDAARRNR